MRSPVRYYGGKGNLKAIDRYVPAGGRPYCEPYCGGASVFFRREPAPVEVLNDLNGDLINLFRVMQDPERFPRLKHAVEMTLYSLAEFKRALDILRDETERDALKRAWAFFVAQNMGFAGKAKSYGDWGRTLTSARGMAEPVSRFVGRVSLFDQFHERLRRVQLDCRDALEVIRYWDTPDTVFYLDPPYHHDTRRGKSSYLHEADHAHHEALVGIILDCKGSVTLSGYAHPVYKPLEYAGWRRIDIATSCHAAGRVRGSGLRGAGTVKAKVSRIESVWINPRAQKLLSEQNTPLIEAGAQMSDV